MAFQDLVWPLAGAAGAAGFAAWAFYQRYYIPVPPGKALVLYGRHSVPSSEDRSHGLTPLVTRQPRILVGGGAVVAPWNRGFGLLSLTPPATEANVRALHSVDGGKAAGWEVSVTVQVKIPTEPEALRRAASSLLGKSDDDVRALVRHAVEGAVPAVLARLPLEPAEPDWERLAAEVEASVAPELVDYGLVVRSVSVTGLRRILPSSELARPAEAKSPLVTQSPTEGLVAVDNEFALRLARVERGLGVMGAQVVRLLRDIPAPSLEESAVDPRPLAAAPSSEGVEDGLYDSTGSGRPPRIARPKSPGSSGEGA